MKKNNFINLFLLLILSSLVFFTIGCPQVVNIKPNNNGAVNLNMQKIYWNGTINEEFDGSSVMEELTNSMKKGSSGILKRNI